VIDIVEGEKGWLGRGGPPRPLLYIVIFCPGVTTGPTGQSTEHDTLVSRFEHTWGLRPSPFSIRLDWDRERDTVSAAGRTFQREKGNVFVLRRQPDGRFVAQQLPSLQDTVDFQAVLRHVKICLPKDPDVAALAVSL